MGCSMLAAIRHFVGMKFLTLTLLIPAWPLLSTAPRKPAKCQRRRDS